MANIQEKQNSETAVYKKDPQTIVFATHNENKIKEINNKDFWEWRLDKNGLLYDNLISEKPADNRFRNTQRK